MPALSTTATPTPLRLTPRDLRILETLHAYDGLLSLSQIDRVFFSGRGRTQPRQRLRRLQEHGYLASPAPETRHRVPVGKTVYWLGPKGAAQVAGLQGKNVDEIRWRRQPRFALLAHHLAVNEFRLAILDAVARLEGIELLYWLPESELWTTATPTSYQDGRGRKRKRRVVPDGFFALRSGTRSHPLGYLIEIDMGTEDNPRFLREKVRPGLAYLKEGAYEQQTGLRYGRWLVITSGPRRLHNMKRQLARVKDSSSFFLTHQALTTDQNPLDAAIWWQAGGNQPVSLLPTANAANQ